MDVELTHERELTEPVDLCLENGRLNRAAVGWSRHPLHCCNLRGAWPWKKRWDFWDVFNDTHMLFVTYGCTDYLGMLNVGVLDYRVGKRVQHSWPLPLAHGMTFPQTVGGGDLRYESKNLGVALLEEPEGTRLQAHARTPTGQQIEVDVLVARPPRLETLNVVIPWSDTRFQFTSKQNCRPARGCARVDERTYEFADGAYGILDFGRGVWPYNTSWNWAAGCGRQGDRLVGLNLGGQWTDNTGLTENGLCIDGRLHKIGEDLQWTYNRQNFSAPWHIRAARSQRVDLAFRPFIEDAQRVELLLVRTELHWVLGHFNGVVVGDDGESIEIHNLLGWAEEHIARW